MATNIISTTADGRLKGQTQADVRAMVEALWARPKALVHFHGGLVNRASGTAGANRISAFLQHPDLGSAFFVWESGLLETLRNNLGEIARETIFRRLLKALLKHVVGKLQTSEGAKAIRGLHYPRDIEVETRIAASERGDGAEIFEDVAVPDTVAETDDAEAETLIEELAADQTLDAELRAIAAASMGAIQTEMDGSKGALARAVSSPRTLLSPEIVAELDAETGHGTKSILGSAKFLARAAAILKRVIGRFVRGRHHGVHATVVEEILRELYIANIGAAIWGAMKKETADTFLPGGGAKGGIAFAEAWIACHIAGKRPEITLSGHSAGSVFILHLIGHLARLQSAGACPPDLGAKQVLFLAPACTHKLMADTLALPGASGLLGRFRMFTMNDALESKDVLVPVIYPRSLLYFISGVLEPGEHDAPIVGMQRFRTNAKLQGLPGVRDVNAFLSADAKNEVFSVAAGTAGLESDAISHGAFAETAPGRNAAMRSVRHVALHGW